MAVAVAMTYDSLVENIESYLERTDTATLEKIPLFILFRALGIETDKEIYNYIFGDELDSNEKEYFDNFIRPSIISSYYIFKDKEIYIYTQNDALNYLKHRVKYGSVEHVKSVIMTEIFPNIDELDNKGKYLGYLILQFILKYFNQFFNKNQNTL